VRAYPLERLPGRTDRPDRVRAERVDVDAEQMVKALAFAQRLYPGELVQRVDDATGDVTRRRPRGG
jgi:hypothetical protein